MQRRRMDAQQRIRGTRVAGILMACDDLNRRAAPDRCRHLVACHKLHVQRRANQCRCSRDVREPEADALAECVAPRSRGLRNPVADDQVHRRRLGTGGSPTRQQQARDSKSHGAEIGASLHRWSELVLREPGWLVAASLPSSRTARGLPALTHGDRPGAEYGVGP